jgi:ubiquinol-cytochrome c reductase cytochrome c1 subunit
MLKFLLKICTIIIIYSHAIWCEEGMSIKSIKWPFEGLLGKVDIQAAQRGFQVYKEVCSTCHSLKHVHYRNLKDIGFSDDEIKALAKQYSVTDGPNDAGDMFERPALPSDFFVSPFKNDQAARAANNNALPVDLSLIIKARHDGPNYIYSLLTGYENAPQNFSLTEGLYYNSYFPGKQIAMPNPLSDGQVTYIDGTTASVDQMSRDLVIFLQWAAEPEMEHRKSLGLKTLLFLIAFTGIFFIANQRLWQKIK